MSVKARIKTIVFEYFVITGGATIISLGLVLFLAPAKIAPGGVSGLAIVLRHLWHLPMGVMMLVFNTPLFVLGIKVLGGKFGPRTLYAFIIVSLTTDLFDTVLKFKAATHNALLASIFGGVVLGLGLGIVFRFRGTTGGSDIVAQIINRYTNFSVGTAIMLVDFIIITIAGAVFQSINLALYGFISLYLSSKVVDLVIDGFDYARSFYIITEKQAAIIKAVTQEMNRGGTLLTGRGFYTGETRDTLFIVVTRKEVSTLRQLVKRVDPRAFIVIANVHEVLGYGFRPRV